MSLTLWNRANCELIAKSLAELLYEEILCATNIGEDFSVRLKSEVNYTFMAKKGVWDFLKIDPQSIKRTPSADQILAETFFRDANLDLEMPNITLTHFLEEMHNTLFSEMQVLQNRSQINTPDLALKSGEALQSYLSGHPKILLNKGRIGFSASDLKKYAPENAGKFQVMWIAVKKEALTEAFSPEFQNYFKERILRDSEITVIQNELKKYNASLIDYALIPVHPWQYERYISVQYQQLIANLIIIPLTEKGPFYTPQISIRTLSNATDAKEYDLKLSLTILNTSAYRGISPENIKSGPELSEFIEDICHNDFFLKEMKTEVLKEVYVASMPHPSYSKVAEAPYRYKEMLGCVVRESASSKLNTNELAIMTGGLFYVGDDHKPLIGEYIKNAKVSVRDWMQRYFRHIVLPLYHLQLSYGIGIVSHGQNIVMRMTNYLPSGVFIKDFQGDLRVSHDFLKTFPENLKSLKALPKEHLIHDLLTGHFLTVLRFISPILEQFNLLKENEFYAILREEVKNYLGIYHPSLKESNPLNLLRPEIEKIILNKVRFQIGYEDSSARPLPTLGKNLKNPLALNKDHI